jgi:hypothetical protein
MKLFWGSGCGVMVGKEERGFVEEGGGFEVRF